MTHSGWRQVSLLVAVHQGAIKSQYYNNLAQDLALVNTLEAELLLGFGVLKSEPQGDANNLYRKNK